MTTTACLIAPWTESATGPSTDTDGTEASTVGPCLFAPPTDTGPDTGTTSSSGSGSEGTDTDTDSTSIGPCLEPPLTGSGTGDTTSAGLSDEAPDHETVIGKVLERGVLPPDVAAKLHRRRP